MNRLHQRLSLLGCLLLASLLSGTANSQENEWYQVELWVFAHDNPSSLDDEYWHPSLTPTFSEHSQALNDSPNLPFGKQPHSALDKAVTNSLHGATDYRLLFQERWFQKVTSREEATPIRIEGGQPLQEGLRELSGEIQLDRGRFLHLRTNLYYSQVPDAWTKVTYRISDEPENTPAEEEIRTFSLFAPLQTQSDALTVAMQQNRRMRSGELHYIDHPLFGLVIRLTPYEKPAPEQAP